MEYDKEFLEIIKPIIDNKEFIKRKKFHHHENESVYDHSTAVGYFAFKFSKKYLIWHTIVFVLQFSH